MLGKRTETDTPPFQVAPSTKKNYGEDNSASKANFSKYRISAKTVEILKAKGIQYLFPIQESTFDPIFDGKDVVGRDLTGSGKTLGFALPLLERLRMENCFTTPRKHPEILIIVPTRELALQVLP